MCAYVVSLGTYGLCVQRICSGVQSRVPELLSDVRWDVLSRVVFVCVFIVYV